MATKVETIGTYIGTVTESAVGLTKTGKPQWVARLKASKKYVESKEDIAHFQAQGLLQDGNPGYIDWTAFEEEIIAFLLLYNSFEEISPQTEMKNVEQLHIATGWVAPDFESIATAPVLGAEILFRVQEKAPYINDKGKQIGGDGTLEVSWIDHKDASPERQLKSADATQIKTLMSLVTGYSNKPAAAKPVVAKPAITKPSQTGSTVTAASSAASPSTVTAPVASAPSAPAAPVTEAPKKTRKAPAPKPPAVVPPVAAPAPAPVTTTTFPPETDMNGAWEAVNLNKGNKEDSQVEELWLSSITGDPAAMTGTDWAKVRDTVIQKLAA